MGRPIRITVTLPGAASLGAYQAGATAALAVVIRELRRRGHDVHVDAVGGSSAGSIVGLLTSHCLLVGRDAARFLREAWVDEVDARLLRSGGTDRPLAFDDLHDRLDDFLHDTDAHPYGVVEPLAQSIDLQVGLTSLLGLRVPVEDHHDDRHDDRHGTIPTLTFADWATFELEPDHDPSVLLRPKGSSPIDAALTSAAHPVAFVPTRLDRNGDRAVYDERGIDDLPGDARLWYTDGGLVESSPVGRVVTEARRRWGPDDGTRLHLVVDPRSSGPSGHDIWRDPDMEKSWMQGLRRAVSIVPTQALHDDIRRIQSINRRLGELDALLSDLREVVDEHRYEEVCRRITSAAGLDGAERVRVETITPLRYVDAVEDAGVSDLLAGDFIGAFGGFLDRDIRRSDFALGWACTRSWVDDVLVGVGVDPDDVDHLLAELDHDGTVGEADAHAEGRGDGVDQLDRSGRWQLALLAAQFARVVVSEAVPWDVRPVQRIRERVRGSTQ